MNEVRVFGLIWAYKWLFLGVFGLVFALGGVYINTTSKATIQTIELKNYAFFITQKVIHQSSHNHNAFFVNNKILNPILNRLLAAPLQSEETNETIVLSIKNHLHIIAPSGYSMGYPDVYWFIYPAQSKEQAEAISDFIKDYIATSPEVQALRAYLESFTPLLKAQNLWSASVNDILENGFFISSAPQLTYTKGFKELAIFKDSLTQGFSKRSMWILLCVSAFVLAALSVFIAAFVRALRKSTYMMANK